MYKVTVGICCYKQKKWLHRCLRSLAAQTLACDNFEVVVVNDDPSADLTDVCDNSADVLNIKLINNDQNLGLPASLNKILSVARGRYFVRVDSDDYVSEDFLYYMALFLDMNRTYQAVACDYKKVNNVGTVVEQHVSALAEPIACGIMFTYESLCEMGFYNEDFKMREGHELMQRFQEKFRIFHLPVSLYRYRLHGANRTLDKEKVTEYDDRLEEKNEA